MYRYPCHRNRSFHQARTRTSSEVYWLLIVTFLLLSGCDPQTAIPIPEINPISVSSGILEEHDTDGNGTLSDSEIKKSQSLTALAANREAALDADGNGQVTSEELSAKVATFMTANRTSCECLVTYQQRFLDGAKVRIVPKDFMGDAIPVAEGVTDGNGQASLATDDGYPGVVAGFYKVEITHPDLELPAKYNTETQLELVIDASNPNAGFPKFNLSSSKGR